MHFKHKNTIYEILKWALVIFLLMPLRNAASGPVSFTRIAIGILLFVIFTGKLLYDTIIEKYLRVRREQSAARDLITTLGIIVVIALVIGVVVLLIGMSLFTMMQKAAMP